MRFKIHENDYFGAYSKLMIASQKRLGAFNKQGKVSAALEAKRNLNEAAGEETQSLVIINQLELDQPKQLRAFEKLMVGLETMLPKMIICIGHFFSEKILETDPFDSFKNYFEQLGQIVKEKALVHLRDTTEWIFVPSIDDPGQMKMMPGLQLSDYLFQGFKGSGPQTNRIQNVALASNPMRICFHGKQIVISRYNYLKRMKQNHLNRVAFVQDKVRGT